MQNNSNNKQQSDTEKQIETAKRTYSYLSENKVIKYVAIGGAAFLALYSLRHVFDVAAVTIISFKRLRRAYRA